jgi:hypothetical protein
MRLRASPSAREYKEKVRAKWAADGLALGARSYTLMKKGKVEQMKKYDSLMIMEFY